MHRDDFAQSIFPRFAWFHFRNFHLIAYVCYLVVTDKTVYTVSLISNVIMYRCYFVYKIISNLMESNEQILNESCTTLIPTAIHLYFVIFFTALEILLHSIRGGLQFQKS